MVRADLALADFVIEIAKRSEPYTRRRLIIRLEENLRCKVLISFTGR
jgi:hypothetical protein